MQRNWNGRHVNVYATDPDGFTRFSMPQDVASKLALSLKRLKNTTLFVTHEMEELITALDFVLVGDPSSVNTQKALKATLDSEEESFPIRVIDSHAYVGDGGACEAERGGGREARCGRSIIEHAYPDSPSDADFEREKERR